MKQYTKQEIEQMIAKLNDQKETKKTSNVFTHWSAWLMYALLIWLGFELLLKLKSIPYIGVGIVIIAVLFLWGLPAMRKTINQNSQLRKENKEKDKQIAQLAEMLKQVK